MLDSKVCSKCKELKALSNFSFSRVGEKRAYRAYRHICKPCANEATLAWHARQKEAKMLSIFAPQSKSHAIESKQSN